MSSKMGSIMGSIMSSKVGSKMSSKMSSKMGSKIGSRKDTRMGDRADKRDERAAGMSRGTERGDATNTRETKMSIAQKYFTVVPKIDNRDPASSESNIFSRLCPTSLPSRPERVTGHLP